MRTLLIFLMCVFAYQQSNATKSKNKESVDYLSEQPRKPRAASASRKPGPLNEFTQNHQQRQAGPGFAPPIQSEMTLADAAQSLLSLSQQDPINDLEKKLQSQEEVIIQTLETNNPELFKDSVTPLITSLLADQKAVFAKKTQTAQEIRRLQSQLKLNAAKVSAAAAQNQKSRSTQLKLGLLQQAEFLYSTQNDMITGTLAKLIHLVKMEIKEKRLPKQLNSLVNLWIDQVIQNADSLDNANARIYPEFKH